MRREVIYSRLLSHIIIRYFTKFGKDVSDQKSGAKLSTHCSWQCGAATVRSWLSGGGCVINFSVVPEY